MALVGRSAVLIAVLVVAGCAPASAPAAGADTPGPSSPAASSAPIDSPEAAAAAVGRFDSNFLGYAERDTSLIGQSAWFEAVAVRNGYEVTFFRGSGDCPAGCIDQAYVKFFVGTDGRVEKRCEWRTGANAQGTPC